MVLDFNNKEITNYFKNNSFIKNKVQSISYYNAQRLLENLGTYLLRGQYKKNGILTIFNIRSALITEIPVSNIKGNAEDLIYGSSSSTDLENMSINATTEKIRYERRSSKSKYTDSKTYRLNKLKKENNNFEFNWCLVDTDNVFHLNENPYKISDEVKEYKVDSNNKYQMEKILCLYDKENNIFKFYNEKIENIDTKYITNI